MAPSWLFAPPEDSFFLMHDTAIPYGSFGEKLNATFDRFEQSDSDIHWAAGRGQCNICFLRRPVSDYACKLWSHRTTMTKDEAVQLEVLLHRDSPKFWTKFRHTCERYRP